jgi:hypothetical protein
MVYVSSDEYLELLHTASVPENYDELEQTSSECLNLATRFFYHSDANQLLDDPVQSRANAFKLALARQIKYMDDTGIKSAVDYSKASAVTSQTIGRTTISKGSTSGTNRSGTILCDEALNILEGAGLTYRGVWHR